MEEVSVGKVTIAEIIGVLQACQDDLTITSLYGALVKLHLAKTGPTKIKVLLDDLVTSRGQIDKLSKSGKRCEWLVYLYDVVIAIILVKKIDDERAKEALREVCRESWAKMLGSL